MRLRVRHVLWAGFVLAQALLSEGKGKDYYGMLGLKKNASESAIKKAYRCVCVLRGETLGERGMCDGVIFCKDRVRHVCAYLSERPNRFTGARADS